ncbi:MAG: HAMP domain-containing sensor histidine kinase [Clostridium sp.]
MESKLIRNGSVGKGKKTLTYGVGGILIISILLISSFIFLTTENISGEELTLYFLRAFNFILASLALASCLMSYTRLKNENIFILSLMYLVLAVDILFGNLDYISFYVEQVTIITYITISTSILRIILLGISFSSNSKLNKLIVNNKKKAIAIIIIYTILAGYIEKNVFLHVNFDSNHGFIVYNLILCIVYILGAFRLLHIGIKEEEQFFIVLAASILILSVKAGYAIYAINSMNYINKVVSVAITYTAFIIVIFGAIIELYIYINKTRVLNQNLEIFYNIVDKNKQVCTIICTEDYRVLYSNKKFQEEYYDSNSDNISMIYPVLKYNNIEKIILNEVKTYGSWRGILKDSTGKEFIECTAQEISILGEEFATQISFKDISDEINMELEIEKLKVYDKEKSEFISNISHELKTPLNIFYSTIQLLDLMCKNDEIDFKDIYKKYNRSLCINCKRMVRLINNVIDVVKIDEGIFKGDFRNYNIISLIEDITMSITDYAILKSINIQFDTNEEESIIRCDASLIQRGMLNLLSNAIKFSKEGSTILVEIIVSDEWIEIHVKDEGLGISSSDKESIFKRFIQVDKSFTRSNEGSGIGLSIVKSIVDLHNGKIELDSEINVGSNFKLFIPNIKNSSESFNSFNVDNKNIEIEFSDIYDVIKL